MSEWERDDRVTRILRWVLALPVLPFWLIYVIFKTYVTLPRSIAISAMKLRSLNPPEAMVFGYVAFFLLNIVVLVPVGVIVYFQFRVPIVAFLAGLLGTDATPADGRPDAGGAPAMTQIWNPPYLSSNDTAMAARRVLAACAPGTRADGVDGEPVIRGYTLTLAHHPDQPIRPAGFGKLRELAAAPAHLGNSKFEGIGEVNRALASVAIHVVADLGGKQMLRPLTAVIDGALPDLSASRTLRERDITYMVDCRARYANDDLSAPLALGIPLTRADYLPTFLLRPVDETAQHLGELWQRLDAAGAPWRRAIIDGDDAPVDASGLPFWKGAAGGPLAETALVDLPEALAAKLADGKLTYFDLVHHYWVSHDKVFHPAFLDGLDFDVRMTALFCETPSCKAAGRAFDVRVDPEAAPPPPAAPVTEEPEDATAPADAATAETEDATTETEATAEPTEGATTASDATTAETKETTETATADAGSETETGSDTEAPAETEGPADTLEVARAKVYFVRSIYPNELYERDFASSMSTDAGCAIEKDPDPRQRRYRLSGCDAEPGVLNIGALRPVRFVSPYFAASAVGGELLTEPIEGADDPLASAGVKLSYAHRAAWDEAATLGVKIVERTDPINVIDLERLEPIVLDTFGTDCRVTIALSLDDLIKGEKRVDAPPCRRVRDVTLRFPDGLAPPVLVDASGRQACAMDTAPGANLLNCTIPLADNRPSLRGEIAPGLELRGLDLDLPHGNLPVEVVFLREELLTRIHPRSPYRGASRAVPWPDYEISELAYHAAGGDGPCQSWTFEEGSGPAMTALPAIARPGTDGAVLAGCIDALPEHISLTMTRRGTQAGSGFDVLHFRPRIDVSLAVGAEAPPIPREDLLAPMQIVVSKAFAEIAGDQLADLRGGGIAHVFEGPSCGDPLIAQGAPPDGFARETNYRGTISAQFFDKTPAPVTDCVTALLTQDDDGVTTARFENFRLTRSLRPPVTIFFTITDDFGTAGARTATNLALTALLAKFDELQENGSPLPNVRVMRAKTDGSLETFFDQSDFLRSPGEVRTKPNLITGDGARRYPVDALADRAEIKESTGGLILIMDGSEYDEGISVLYNPNRLGVDKLSLFVRDNCEAWETAWPDQKPACYDVAGGTSQEAAAGIKREIGRLVWGNPDFLE